MDFPGSSDGKVSAYNAGDPGSIPGSGKSPGEENGNLLQYSYLENFMDREEIHFRELQGQIGRLHSMGSQRIRND